MVKKNKSITQNDVARAAGVTRSLVSYVINDSSSRSIAPETRQKILDAIETLGYHPNKAAQALQLGNEGLAHNQIGIILCNADVFKRPYYADIISGIYSEAHKKCYHIHFVRFFDELKDKVLFNQLIHKEEIGSLILLSINQCIKSEEDYSLIKRIKERILRIVCVEWEYEGLSSVSFNRRLTAMIATEHLFNKGYSDIAYIGEADDRINGVKDAYNKRGLDASSLPVYPAFDMAGGERITETLFQNKMLPRAIVFGSDEIAISSLCILNRHKIEVPDRVAVVSIDNIEGSKYTIPPLTTMNVQKALMGQTAVDLIVSNKAHQGEEASHIELATNIVERFSS